MINGFTRFQCYLLINKFSFTKWMFEVFQHVSCKNRTMKFLSYSSQIYLVIIYRKIYMLYIGRLWSVYSFLCMLQVFVKAELCPNVCTCEVATLSDLPISSVIKSQHYVSTEEHLPSYQSMNEVTNVILTVQTLF